MGIFSSIGKAFKSVFQGILKVFQPILEPLGKLMNSDWGKAIMIGLSIFTLGSAMVAGYGAFTTAMAAPNATFAGSFMQGASAFMSSLTGGAIGKAAPEGVTGATNVASQTAEGLMQSGQTAQNLVAGGPEALVGAAEAGAGAGASAMSQGGALSEGAMQTMAATSPGQAGGVAGTGGMGGTANLPVPEGVNPALEASTGIAPTTTTAPTTGITSQPPEGWLSKAAKAGGDFIKSESGGQIVGSLIQGVGNYYTEKDRQEFEDRIRRDWAKGSESAGVREARAQSARAGRLQAPSAQDIARASRDTASENYGRPTFQRAYGASAGG